MIDKPHHEAMIDLLVSAKSTIEAGTQMYICEALREQFEAAPTLYKPEYDALMEMIKEGLYMPARVEGLGGYHWKSLAVWLSQELRYKCPDLWSRLTKDNKNPLYHQTGLQAMCRMAWIDRMIEQLSNPEGESQCKTPQQPQQ